MPTKVYLNVESVKAIMAKKNMDQRTLAKLVGVSDATITFWLHRKKCPNIKSRKKLQKVLGKTRAWDSIFDMQEQTSSGEAV